MQLVKSTPKGIKTVWSKCASDSGEVYVKTSFATMEDLFRTPDSPPKFKVVQRAVGEEVSYFRQASAQSKGVISIEDPVTGATVTVIRIKPPKNIVTAPAAKVAGAEAVGGNGAAAAPSAPAPSAETAAAEAESESEPESAASEEPSKKVVKAAKPSKAAKVPKVEKAAKAPKTPKEPKPAKPPKEPKAAKPPKTSKAASATAGEEVSEKERRILQHLSASKTKTATLAEMAGVFKEVTGAQANSWARNTIRRPVRLGWMIQTDRGVYQITPAGSAALSA